MIAVPLHPAAADVRQRAAIAAAFGPRTAARLGGALAGWRISIEIIARDRRAYAWIYQEPPGLLDQIARSGLEYVAVEVPPDAPDLYIVRCVAGHHHQTSRSALDLAPAGAA